MQLARYYYNDQICENGVVGLVAYKGKKQIVFRIFIRKLPVSPLC
jgi:hypothetical protein